MRTYLRRLGPFVLAGLLMAGWAVAQNSPGGSFLPGFNYIVSGQWTWRNIASPWIIEGTTEDANETTVTFTEPTADRTFTIGNQTGTAVVRRDAGASPSRGQVEPAAEVEQPPLLEGAHL